MRTKDKLDKVLGIIRYIMDNDEKLTQLLEFLENEILEDDTENDTSQEENHMEQIPEKYKKVIKEIAENMGANLISYFNPDTFEIEIYHENMIMEMYDEDDEDEEWLNPELKWDNCITVDPLESCDSFRIMERFVDQLMNKKEAACLSQALNGAKPFANFNHIIHNSEFRQYWFDFRQKELEKYVINNYFYDIDELTKK